MTRVITRACAAYRAPGADDLARAEAREALALLTEREVAMFALSLLLEVKSPVLFAVLSGVAQEVQAHSIALRHAATRADRGL